MAMIRRGLALTYYLYALRLTALSHFYFNRLYKTSVCVQHGLLLRRFRFVVLLCAHTFCIKKAA